MKFYKWGLVGFGFNSSGKLIDDPWIRDPASPTMYSFAPRNITKAPKNMYEQISAPWFKAWGLEERSRTS